jgi:hypothetical protein
MHVVGFSPRRSDRSIHRLEHFAFGGELLLLDVPGDGRMEDGVARPDGPGDAGEFVGEGHGGSVVAATLLNGERPASQAIWLV